MHFWANVGKAKTCSEIMIQTKASQIAKNYKFWLLPSLTDFMPNLTDWKKNSTLWEFLFQGCQILINFFRQVNWYFVEPHQMKINQNSRNSRENFIQNISWNQFHSKFVNKLFIFTKFLSKKCLRKFLWFAIGIRKWYHLIWQ